MRILSFIAELVNDWKIEVNYFRELERCEISLERQNSAAAGLPVPSIVSVKC